MEQLECCHCCHVPLPYSGKLHATHGQRRTTFLRVETGATPARPPPLLHRYHIARSAPLAVLNAPGHPTEMKPEHICCNRLFNDEIFYHPRSYLRPRQMRNCLMHQTLRVDDLTFAPSIPILENPNFSTYSDKYHLISALLSDQVEFFFHLLLLGLKSVKYVSGLTKTNSPSIGNKLYLFLFIFKPVQVGDRYLFNCYVFLLGIDDVRSIFIKGFYNKYKPKILIPEKCTKQVQ